MNMQILYALESIRTPFFNYLFLGISYLGSEVAAAIVMFAILWCIDKKKGYFVMANVLIGSGVNQTIKLAAHVARPFVAHSDFTVVEEARATTGGFSFPSGHTQNSTSLFGSIFLCWKSKGLRIFCVVMTALVAFSRIYLGCHYPTDVLGGFVVGLVILILLSFAFRGIEKHPWLLSVIFMICGAMLLIVLALSEFGPWSGYTTAEEMAEMLKGVGIIAGALFGVALGEPIERKYVCYETKAVWWAQIIKVAGGFGIMYALSFLMKFPASAIFGSLSYAYVLRFFVAVVFGICVWPLTFRYFPKPKE